MYGQEEFSYQDADVLVEAARNVVKRFGIYLNLLGSPEFSAAEKEEMIQNVILNEIVASRKSLFSNDLDPTGTLLKELEIETYLHNVKVGYFPPKGGGVIFGYDSLDNETKIYKHRRRDEFFVKVVVDRYLKGEFALADQGQDVENYKKIDFYVKVFQKGKKADPISIYTMDLHKNNTSVFKEVSVAALKVPILSEVDHETLSRDLYKARRDIEYLEREILSLKQEKQFLGIKVDQEKLVNQGLEGHDIIPQQGQELPESFAQMKDGKADLQQTKIGEQEEASEQQVKLQHELLKLAQENRVGLKFGPGAGVMLGKEYHQNNFTVNTAFLTASLWLRLSPLLVKKKGTRTPISLVVFGRIGKMEGHTTRLMLKDQDLSSVEPGLSGGFGDVEAGLVIWDYFRLSVGIGYISYLFENDELYRKQLYRATAGLNSPEIANILQLGLNFTLSSDQLDFHQENIRHPSIHAAISFKLE